MSTSRIINFCAGPSKLPEDVMLQVQNELLNYKGSGISVLEMSHRSPKFAAIVEHAKETVRQLLNIPDNYKVLFMAGGGTGQFAALPLNLIQKTGKAIYLTTGTWSSKAAKEATKYGKVQEVKLDSILSGTTDSELDQDASYFYYCDNETVHGVELQFIPDTKGIPLVADMSSNILTRYFDITKFALVFAGAQKNIGPAGVTLVIVRDDMLDNALPECPSVFNYSVMAKDNSLFNTPPCFSLYITGLVFEWIKQQGGVDTMEKRSAEKSRMVYDVIDHSNGFYLCSAPAHIRSRVNVTFRIRNDEELEKKFLKQAEERGMIQLKGHRSVGGIRASLYNAVNVDEVVVLAEFMKEFMVKSQS